MVPDDRRGRFLGLLDAAPAGLPTLLATVVQHRDQRVTGDTTGLPAAGGHALSMQVIHVGDGARHDPT